MYDVLIRFKFIKNDYIFEAVLDSRLSFKDNFKLLQNIIDIDIKNVKVYDPKNRVFLNRDIPIKQFDINYFVYFYLY